ncbi:MAG: hypothetical protein NDI69_04320 [Bacteriovoracaceae bacterium]|nr:hypothetical protein [Bacteriovoracaceae bacterium]
MSRSHYFYFPLSVEELEQVVDAHIKDFETIIGDLFTEDEVKHYEKMLDSIAAIYVQPILSELTFEDFYADASLLKEQQSFFESCRSSICLEGLPYLESNPFQVSYLKLLLSHFSEVLIDRGGIQDLQFKQVYLDDLNKYKVMESLVPDIPAVKVNSEKKTRPVDPIDFLVADVYKEIARITVSGNARLIDEALQSQSQKVQKIYLAFQGEELDSSDLFKKSGLNPKDFDDHLERFKFLLKKI